MKAAPFQREGYELLHNGTVALSQVEGNGIRIDLKGLERMKKLLQLEIHGFQIALHKDKIWGAWKRRYGKNANMLSRDQLATVLQGLGYELTKLTMTGKTMADEETLMNLNDPFVTTYLRMTKYEKALRTYLRGIEREIVDDRIHPTFNLNAVRTFRSSSEAPNFQNMPVRDKEIAQIIRTLFIPSPGSVLVENDFKGIEVGVSACYHKDQNFISYITTPGKDMHRDMAAQIYMLKPEQVSKEARYGAKNKFVFPQFYGDFYVACARNLWDWIEKGKLTGPGGIPLKEHLRAKGIKRLGACNPDEEPLKGTFERHLKEVEDDFWNNRFMDYGKWRKQWYYTYLERGYFDLYTGFRISGFLGRNEVTNYPIQGSAFHCLLWSLIQINRLLNKYHMKSLIVGQIHDSLVGDVQVKELRQYLEIVEEVTTVRLRKHYKDWLIIPLGIDYEIAPEGKTWHDKQAVKFEKGRFFHPADPKKSTTDAETFLRVLAKHKPK